MRALALALALVALAPLADAHPWGRSTFEREENGGVAFLFAVIPDVPEAGRAIPVHVEVRDAANGTLLDALGVNATLRRPAGNTTPLALEREGPGRFTVNVTVPAPGAWVVDVAWSARDAGAAFTFHAFPDHRYRADWLPMAREYAQAGVPGNVSVAVWDDETSEVLSPPPADAVLIVDAWTEFHEERVGHWEVPFPPSPTDDRVLATSFTWPRAGAFDLRVIVPSLGLALEAQPAFDVHAFPHPPPWTVDAAEDAVADAPSTLESPAGGVLALVALGVVAACAVRRPRG